MLVSLSSLVEHMASRYSDSDDVYLIAKGASIDEIELDRLGRGLILNLNDSERILAGDVCLFHSPWVPASLRECGTRCDYYVTSASTVLPNAPCVVVEHIPATHDSADLITCRFQSDALVLEDILFISALKLVQLIGEQKRRVQKAWMLGFDFRIGARPYSHRIGTDHSRHDMDFKRSIILAQEAYLLDVLSLTQRKLVPWLDVVHVGKAPYSKMSPEQFNCSIRHNALARCVTSTGGTAPSYSNSVGPTSGRVLVVAEFTNNHHGDTDRLRRMVRLAARAGADLVKVQKRDVDTFYSPEQLASPYESPFGKTLGDYRRAVELDPDGFQALDDECRTYGIGWFCSVLDWPSYQSMAQFRKRLLKLPSTISERRDLHERIAKDYQGEIVVSTGFTTGEYEDFVLHLFSRNDRIYLLQANSAYPTPPFQCSIGVVRHYRDLGRRDPRIVPGYSSHDLGSLGSLLAVAAGARMLEKHVKLGETPWVHFDHVALDLESSAFTDYVRDVRLAEQMCGQETKTIQAAEDHKYFAAPKLVDADSGEVRS